MDGVYSADPHEDPSATKYDDLTYDEAIAQGLQIMDQTAFTLCSENKLPMVVFGMRVPPALCRRSGGQAAR